MLIILIHVPPGLDFRYWEIPEGKINVNVGMKKPFLCDNFGVFMVLRLYLWLRCYPDIRCPQPHTVLTHLMS